MENHYGNDCVIHQSIDLAVYSGIIIQYFESDEVYDIFLQFLFVLQLLTTGTIVNTGVPSRISRSRMPQTIV